MACPFTKEQLTDEFKSTDTDGNGALSQDEILACLKSLGGDYDAEAGAKVGFINIIF